MFRVYLDSVCGGMNRAQWNALSTPIGNLIKISGVQTEVADDSKRWNK